jgi:hypothetical protein
VEAFQIRFFSFLTKTNFANLYLDLLLLLHSLRTSSTAFEQELHEFFVDYMVNDNLGQISNAHVVFSDSEPLKARSHKCIELARLFSVAVDFPKTGVPAIIPSYLRPKDYPDFMEKEDKVTYKSQCVIGTLFRSVKEVAKEQSFSLELTKQSMLLNYDLQLQVKCPQPKLSFVYRILVIRRI